MHQQLACTEQLLESGALPAKDLGRAGVEAVALCSIWGRQVWRPYHCAASGAEVFWA